MELWSDAVEVSMKDIEHKFGSMNKRFPIFVTPIANRPALRVEQILIVWCVLHSHLLDYNDANNWRERMFIVACKGEPDEFVPLSIDNDHSFLRSHYRHDHEFGANI
jgi:hypothetical protein